MSVSEQMANLRARYKVRNEKELIRAIRAEYERETGERFTLRDAAVILDQMLEAEYQRIAGGAYDATEG
jgi:hypothetical protein